MSPRFDAHVRTNLPTFKGGVLTRLRGESCACANPDLSLPVTDLTRKGREETRVLHELIEVRGETSILLGSNNEDMNGDMI